MIIDAEIIETSEAIINPDGDKIHPWRICPIGKHFVKKHIVHIPPSKEHPDGETIERHEHCATNPSKKDILSFDEIQAITEKYFHQLSGPPKSGVFLIMLMQISLMLKFADGLAIGMIFFLFPIHFRPI